MLKQFGDWQIARVRAAYVKISDRPSPVPGYEGMIEEMAWGHANLDDEATAMTHESVLETAFFGRLGTFAIQRGWKLAPSMMAKVMSSASPTALEWLVGPIRAEGTTNVIPVCKFRQLGGPQMCEHVCRRPSEDFCARRTVPVQLEPDLDSLACTWTWGR